MGGAEVAAYELFRALSDRGDCKAWFLGCDRTPGADRSGNPIRQPYSDIEYVYSAGEFNWFNFANRDPMFPEAFAELLVTLQPNIIHFHHYAVLGVEALAFARRIIPDIKVVLTLHEFLAICFHYGQMITKPDRRLCFEATTRDCAACFPDIPKGDFFLRRRYVQTFFESVDQFLSPSSFLAERYISWGVPSKKISVLENVVPAPIPVARPECSSLKRSFRVGFFGQISAFKGINVLLDAARLLERKRSDVVVDIFGDYQNQPAELQEEFKCLAQELSTNVCMRGSYRPDRVDVLMQSVDVVVVPSIWWENSPLVIQEALRNRRPVICSGIGGMAEKIRDGLDGFHFAVGSAFDLAELITRICDERTILEKVCRTMQTPSNPTEACQKHVDCYLRLADSSDTDISVSA